MLVANCHEKYAVSSRTINEKIRHWSGKETTGATELVSAGISESFYHADYSLDIVQLGNSSLSNAISRRIVASALVKRGPRHGGLVLGLWIQRRVLFALIQQENGQ